MYLKGNLRESSSALLLSYPSLFLLLHLSSSSYSIIFLLHILYFPLLLIRTLSILIHHLPPLASMPPRIPIFSYSHPFSSLSASSSSSYTSFSSFSYPLLYLFVLLSYHLTHLFVLTLSLLLTHLPSAVSYSCFSYSPYQSNSQIGCKRRGVVERVKMCVYVQVGGCNLQTMFLQIMMSCLTYSFTRARASEYLPDVGYTFSPANR